MPPEQKIHDLLQEERRLTFEILLHLRDIEIQKIFLQLGYPTLFEYAVKELKYSESAAYQRIQAMRLLREFPELETTVAKGELSLSAITQVQSFCRRKFLSRTEKLTLFQKIKGLPPKETAQLLVTHHPDSTLLEKIRFLSGSRVEMTLIMENELRKKMEHLKSTRSHKESQMTYQQLLEELVQLGIKKWDPSAWNTRPKENPSSRRVPNSLRSQVWRRDGTCTYTFPETGKRCGSTHLLQVDHIRPFTLGGKTELGNLRLLCAQHNQWRARQTFGPQK